MKNLIIKIKLGLLSILFLAFAVSNAQTRYEEELETVYLNDNLEEVVYTNNFSNYNKNLISSDEIDFRKQIKKAKLEGRFLLFLSERSNLEILTAGYLKTIRKGANRSRDAEAFAAFLRDKLPELKHQFKKDNNLQQLYSVSRKSTFNGKIDDLPSVLSIDF